MTTSHSPTRRWSRGPWRSTVSTSRGRYVDCARESEAPSSACGLSAPLGFRSDHLCHFQGDFSGRFVLPVSEHRPPVGLEPSRGFGVARTIANDLVVPVVDVGCRAPVVLRAPVPIAAVDEHGHPCARECDVGRSPRKYRRSKAFPTTTSSWGRRSRSHARSAMPCPSRWAPRSGDIWPNSSESLDARPHSPTSGDDGHTPSAHVAASCRVDHSGSRRGSSWARRAPESGRDQDGQGLS